MQIEPIIVVSDCEVLFFKFTLVLRKNKIVWNSGRIKPTTAITVFQTSLFKHYPPSVVTYDIKYMDHDADQNDSNADDDLWEEHWKYDVGYEDKK